MKKYKCLIFDADHTLLNYLADERAVFCRLYERLGVPISEELLKASRKYSEETWTEAGLYEVHDTRIQKEYHRLYRSHVEGIFEKIFALFPCPNAAFTAKEAGELFLKELAGEGNAFDGAEETLCALSDLANGKYAVYIATNGLADIQTGRLIRLKRYARGVYISEELGAIKPLPAFFERILSDTGAKREECLMIGDSLYSDVAGAKAAGMDGCWFNPRGEKNTTAFLPDYEIRALQELKNLLE